MKFKTIVQSKKNYESPIELFADLKSGRQVNDLMHIQGKIINSYTTSENINAENIALEMSTGTGKTLVGLLIAEWRRIRFQEKVIYLCPTTQLAKQVQLDAVNKYGIQTALLTGKIADYPTAEKTSYKLGNKVIVTTYSALFNSSPFFEEPDTIILDDAHSADSYISGMYSIDINSIQNSEYFSIIMEFLREFLEEYEFSYYSGKISKTTDSIKLIPFTDYASKVSDFVDIFDKYLLQGTSNYYAWQNLRLNFEMLNIYLSYERILIRPYIYPLFAHKPFANSKHKIYLSATIGNDGYLERLFSIKSLIRLKASIGSENQGVGRRFILFPTITANPENTPDFLRQARRRFGRLLCLVPNENQKQKYTTIFKDDSATNIISISDIEKSKENFTKDENAVAIIANRYDGIDFPGNECRLLVIADYPVSINLQDSFFIKSLSAGNVFKSIINTRIVQSIGRCNRSAIDSAAIIILGEKITDYILTPKNLELLHTELQAEIEFGMEQSKNVPLESLLDLLDEFNSNSQEWQGANQQIISLRDARETKINDYEPILQEISSLEVKYFQFAWYKDYSNANRICMEILGKLTDKDLMAYRIFWNYTTGLINFLLSNNGENIPLKTKSIEYFRKAAESCIGKSWLSSSIFKIDSASSIRKENDKFATVLTVKLEDSIINSGRFNNSKYTIKKAEIQSGLKSNKAEDFENAQRLLGSMLGFESFKLKEAGAADCVWYLEDVICFVFEDNNEASKKSILAPKKFNQANRHRERISDYLKLSENVPVWSIIISDANRIHKSDLSICKQLYLWSTQDFISWSEQAIKYFESIRSTFTQESDIFWREKISNELTNSVLHLNSIKKELEKLSFKNLEIIDS